MGQENVMWNAAPKGEEIASSAVRMGADGVAPAKIQEKAIDPMEAALALFKNGQTPVGSYETTAPLPLGGPAGNGKGGIGRK